MNRQFRPSRHRWWVAMLLVAAVALLRWLSPERPEPLPEPPASDFPRAETQRTTGSRDTGKRDAGTLTEGEYTVDRVVDGDTLLLSGGERVRLLAVNAPESVRPDHPVEAWGKEASAFTRQFIGKHPVRVTFDAEKLDQHDRYLAYVWVEDRLLNEELVRAGLAKANTHFDNDPAMERRLSNAESEARKAKRGIWSGPARN